MLTSENATCIEAYEINTNIYLHLIWVTSIILCSLSIILSCILLYLSHQAKSIHPNLKCFFTNAVLCLILGAFIVTSRSAWFLIKSYVASQDKCDYLFHSKVCYFLMEFNLGSDYLISITLLMITGERLFATMKYATYETYQNLNYFRAMATACWVVLFAFIGRAYFTSTRPTFFVRPIQYCHYVSLWGPPRLEPFELAFIPIGMLFVCIASGTKYYCKNKATELRKSNSSEITQKFTIRENIYCASFFLPIFLYYNLSVIWVNVWILAYSLINPDYTVIQFAIQKEASSLIMHIFFIYFNLYTIFWFRPFKKTILESNICSVLKITTLFSFHTHQNAVIPLATSDDYFASYKW
uniref:G_PROTEIN_RECEP_F1_2 domain-containing protein n=1 Tax=Rhabditophanes sp. KR3021 TaxID=114890 RepID=A0AC35TH05_9BILA